MLSSAQLTINALGTAPLKDMGEAAVRKAPDGAGESEGLPGEKHETLHASASPATRADKLSLRCHSTNECLPRRRFPDETREVKGEPRISKLPDPLQLCVSEHGEPGQHLPAPFYVNSLINLSSSLPQAWGLGELTLDLRNASWKQFISS